VDTILISGYTSIFASKPILAIQFMESEEPGVYTSPSAILITPLEQYQAGYVFTGTQSGYENYLMLAIDSQFTNGLFLDGSLVDSSDWENIPRTNIVGKVEILSDRQQHYIYHENDQVSFSASVFGSAQGTCSYGFSAGMCLADIRVRTY